MTDHRQILVALRQITRAIDLHSKQLTKTVGLTAPQLLVLQALEKTGRAKPSDIAREVHLSQATITSIVDRLIRAGLADRERNLTDRRVVEVVLTDAGRARIQEAPALLQEGFVERFNRLEPWEQSQLIAAVQRLASMMNVEKMDAAPILQIGDLQE